MECASCFLRYNAKVRRPLVITCGHTICQNCLKTCEKCRVCGSSIIPDKNYPLNFSLMEILEKDTKQIDKYVKICFVGSSTTGKTSLIKRLMGKEFIQETITTIGYDFSFHDRMVKDLQVRYQLWDSAGQEKYRAISPIHYKNADIVVVVYDMAQPGSSNKVNDWICEAVSNCPSDVKLMVVGNKIDLTQQNKVYKPVDELAWNEIRLQGYTHMELSCKTAFGINAFWEAIDLELMKKLNERKNTIRRFDNEIQEVQRRNEKMTRIKKRNTSKIQEEVHRTNNSKSCC